LHREQYRDVKTRDYKRLSIILHNLKPACATFLSAAKCFMSSSVYEQVEKQIRLKRK